MCLVIYSVCDAISYASNFLFSKPDFPASFIFQTILSILLYPTLRSTIPVISSSLLRSQLAAFYIFPLSSNPLFFLHLCRQVAYSLSKLSFHHQFFSSLPIWSSVSLGTILSALVFKPYRTILQTLHFSSIFPSSKSLNINRTASVLGNVAARIFYVFNFL